MLNLKNIRMNKHMTLKVLSIKSNIAIGYISDLENGKARNPSLFILVSLAEALGVTVQDLVLGD